MMRSILLAFALATTACGTHYAFIPAPPAHVVPAYNRDAAYVAIPEQDPHGDLRVLSFGMERLTAGDPEEPSADDDVVTLHVRVMIENTGSKPWTFDTREQQIVPDGLAAAESPAFVVSDRAGDGSVPPVVNLTFGSTRVVDLFYVVPNGLDAMPPFRAMTKVRTDEGDVTVTTPFQRVSVSILSPYMLEDEGDSDYDYLDETFLTGLGGVAGLRSRGHAWWGGAGAPGAGGSGHARGGHARGGGGHGRSGSGHRGSSGGGGGHRR